MDCTDKCGCLGCLNGKDDHTHRPGDHDDANTPLIEHKVVSNLESETMQKTPQGFKTSHSSKKPLENSEDQQQNTTISRGGGN